MNITEKNLELMVLLISDNDADLPEVTKQLEKTTGLSCRLWHCPGVVTSSGFFTTALLEVDIVLLDTDLWAADPPREICRQLQEIVHGIPILVFREGDEHEFALMVAEEASEDLTKETFTTDSNKICDVIEFALARAAIHKKDPARSQGITALAHAIAEASVLLDKTMAHANENLRQAEETAGITELLTTPNAKLHGKNDQTIQ